jgi:hypothetical protein
MAGFESAYPAGQLLGPVLKLLRLDSRVKDALPNLSLMGSSTVTDPYFYRQTNLRDMRVPEAWDAQPDASGIVVAILDTGYQRVQISTVRRFCPATTSSMTMGIRPTTISTAR